MQLEKFAFGNDAWLSDLIQNVQAPFLIAPAGNETEGAFAIALIILKF